MIDQELLINVKFEILVDQTQQLTTHNQQFVLKIVTPTDRNGDSNCEIIWEYGRGNDYY